MHTRKPLELLRPFSTIINGHNVTMGDCPCCGRPMRRSCINVVGARCHYEGTQFDRSGTECWNLMMEPAQIRERRTRAHEIYANTAGAHGYKLFASIPETISQTTGHTPGPWNISKLATPDYAPEFGIYADGQPRDLARVIGDNAEANARLIKAAPALFAACVAALDNPDEVEAEKQVREAVALAEQG